MENVVKVTVELTLVADNKIGSVDRMVITDEVTKQLAGKDLVEGFNVVMQNGTKVNTLTPTGDAAIVTKVTVKKQPKVVVETAETDDEINDDTDDEVTSEDYPQAV